MAREDRITTRFAALVVALSLVLGACGGSADTQDAAATSASREQPQAFFPAGPIPPDAHLKGMWSPVYNWPLIPLHALLMPDGRVLSYGTTSTGVQTGYFNYDLWDADGAPTAGHQTLANGTGTDLFCSSQILLQSGDVLLSGGDNWTGTATTNTGNNNSNVLSKSTSVLARGLNMKRPRWYATSTTLINGETYIQGGSGGTDRPEIRGLDGTFRLLAADTSAIKNQYPRNFVAPDGRLFGFDWTASMYYIDTAGSGSVTTAGAFTGAVGGVDSSAAMFRPGRILQFGGGSNRAIIIDINSGAPVVTATQSLSSRRRYVNATILPDGKVLATGGSDIANQLTGVNNIAEIWNPQTGQWSQGAVGALARLYHSVALLLPDGSVLVGGGGAAGPLNNTNVEVYYPPYLFAAGGVRATRPAITLAPTALTIGKTFNVDYSGAGGISRVTLIKTGAVTHSWNMEQRFLDLTFAVSGSRITVQSPTRAVDATPGYYQLFIFNSAGVPSPAHILRIGVASNPNPALVPTLANPANQSGETGRAASLQLAASDPNGDTLRYSATGLPPGLSLNTATGLISGTPTTAGSHNVVVSASDGINADSASFVWNIIAGSGLSIDVVPVPSPVQDNGTASYTAGASGTNVRYKWNFGDGTPETAWSSSPTTSHTFTQPGTYWVTVTATDDSNLPQSRSFMQAVYLPLSAGKPTASSNIAVETPASGNPRIWVVNQDNDSVSVFDAVTRAKLGETTVGIAPRTLALAGNGTVWVTNKQSATISVISAATRAVARTITLPRASMPFGIAMSPNGTHAFVALEATGQVLKFDTSSYAQLGAGNAGPNIRQLAVSSDGSTVHVSRFITRALPGESTASVATSAASGGEVVQLDAASMAGLRTVVLHHSDKPDFENEGRGIPNYLGALAISPDGTQGWVPSKQDNVKRGTLRDGNNLNFQSTVRAISSRIVLGSGSEDLARRIDHDNASVASAALFDRYGVYLFVALETSREVAVIDAHGGGELMRFDAGRAPQGLALSANGKTLYVNNFMDRTVGVFDLSPLVERGEASVTSIAMLSALGTEKLAANVLLGKKLFYDARDTRLSRDSYMSCASCHNDGSHDGRVWDLTGLGEGLRNTVALRGRAGAQGPLHWSHNFNEVQDFEGQIRTLAGGTGLMSDAAFNTGTRSQPLGDAKAGISADLDALAAYVQSLNRFDDSPYRPSSSAVSANATLGRKVFQDRNCAGCHGGTAFTRSGTVVPPDIGSIKPSSGKRLNAALTGIDIPTLRDVWMTAPYLHDGSAPTLEQAVRGHANMAISDADLGALVTYLRETGREEPGALAGGVTGTGTGLTGSYFTNATLSGAPALVRNEAVNFDWGTGSPGTAFDPNLFSVRWSGKVQAQFTGAHTFQTQSSDGIRLWVNGALLIDNWTAHGFATDTSAAVQLVAGGQYTVTIEFYDRAGSAAAKLRWRPPGAASHVAVPLAQLYPG